MLIYVCRFVYGKPIQKYVCQKCVGGITWPKNVHAQSQFGVVNRPVTPVLLISTIRSSSFSMDEKEAELLQMRNLK